MRNLPLYPGHPWLAAATVLLFVLFLASCSGRIVQHPGASGSFFDTALVYKTYRPQKNDRVVSRSHYLQQLHGFWLGQCIANWTGLVTEMDKIGGAGKNGRCAGFYTRENWGGPDHPNLWNSNKLSDTIHYLFENEQGIWGADDDTDIEYIYQHLLLTHKTSLLTGRQIREGWMKHIRAEEENYLWVSNPQAFDLMKAGMEPPATGHPDNHPHYEMIDAQLTTEIFGFFAPARPDIALKMAHLPIQTTARHNAEWASEFYVVMYALASRVDERLSMKEKVFWMADMARKRLPNTSYSAKMYDFVKNKYDAGASWEQTRDALHEKYQVHQDDGYTWSTRDTFCNGCFASGINFGSSIISLLYGEGDLRETIKIAALAGWDSDNPTATWGGLLGFMLGKEGVEKAFGRTFSDKFNIHRTRVGFPDKGIDSFYHMAKNGVYIVDRVVQEQMNGGVDLKKDVWYIPDKGLDFPVGQ
ncbi:MAG: ADP-ribosylglycohydrolase family protein [Lewinellaceae bacterium]|nr:ADP-ribosylglycohydrolase family protein [Lewinellaceae bacterium]